MFLRKIPYQSVRRRRIRDWLLLADAARGAGAHRARVRASLLPARRRWRPRRRTARARRSSSSIRRTAWNTAIAGRRRRPPRPTRSAALGPGDRASLVFFSSGAEVAVRSAGDRGRLESGLAAATTGPGATRYAPALKLAGSLLGESALPRREIILISDFQRRGWEQTPGRDDVKLPERTTLTPVNVASGETANLSVTPVSLQRTRFENHDRVVVTAGVVNHSSKPVPSVDALARGRRQRRSSRCRPTSAPGGSSSVTFSAVHRRVAQHARHGAAAGRRAEARQRVPLRRVAVRAGPRRRRSTAAAPSARRCTCRARSPSANRRASS